MAELKRLFSSLENAELAHRAETEREHALVLNQLHALSAYSHMAKHKYLTTMKDTFAGQSQDKHDIKSPYFFSSSPSGSIS
jgi:hypothetical protein